MTPERWEKIEELFQAAVARPPEEQCAFLNQACVGDESLRREIEKLLASDRAPNGSLEEVGSVIAAGWILENNGPDLIGQSLDRYEVLALLGSGGMGEVYLARDTRLDRKVALKLLPLQFTQDAERLRRFEQEARSASALNHPNIITIYEVAEWNGAHFIAMEYIDGETLSDHMPKRPQLSALLEIGQQISGALAAAHAAGIIHRDIKPANIMLRQDGYIKVLDFGLAKLSSKGAPSDLTNPDRVMGTISYMSPEQALRQPVDHRTDIFSLGAVLYEMATGHRPFEGESEAAIYDNILNKTPRPLADFTAELPVELHQVIRRALAKDPDQRYQSASDLREELQRLAHQQNRIESAGVKEKRPSIAVLPFTNMSGESGQEYFSDGITEDIITDLSKISGLAVISRHTSFTYKNKSVKATEVSRELRVDFILEGSVRKAGSRVRVTGQLINCRNGTHLWADRYDRDLTDIFAMQDEITHAIVEQLKVKLLPEEQESIAATPTKNLEAYDYYLKGRELLYRGSKSGFKAAREMFVRAVNLDPQYARAYAGIADCDSFLYQETSELLSADSIIRTADKALALDDGLAEAHASRGAALSGAKRYDEAAAEFEKAIRLDPNSFEGYYFFARACILQGKMEQATDLFERGASSKPDDYQCMCSLPPCYHSLGRHEEAKEAARKGAKLAERRLILHPNDARAAELGSICLIELGETERAREWIARALALEPENPQTLYNAACGYAKLGDIDESFDLLERRLRSGSPGCASWIEHDSSLDVLRNDPRYQQLIAQAERRDADRGEPDRDQYYQTASELREDVKLSARRSGSTGALAAKTGWHSSAIPEKSIAVLPFENLSRDPDNAFFTDGVQEEVLTHLAKIADLKVISRTSVMLYKSGNPRNLREIGEQLGVAHLLEGSVQRAENRVRVMAHLIDARTDAHLWAQTYDRTLADVFAIQSEIARTIADQLQARLSPKEKAAIEQRPTADLAAYDLYVSAKALRASNSWNLDARMKEKLLQAASLLDQAVAQDPAFFLAYCQLADVHESLYFSGADHTPARVALAENAVKAALRLRPDSGEAHLALAAHVYHSYLHYEGARQELAIARRALPNDSSVFELTAYVDRRQGRWEDSVANLKCALQLDPGNLFIFHELSVTYQLLRQYGDMAAVLDRALAIAPGDANTRVARAWVDLELRADPKPMHAAIQAVIAENPGATTDLAEQWLQVALCERDSAATDRALAAISSDGLSKENIWFPRAWYEGLAARTRGDAATARAAFAVARAQLEKTVREQPNYAQGLSVLGMIDAGLGRKEEAIGEGRRAVELLPVGKDAFAGGHMMRYLAIIYTWTGEKNLAIEQLAAVIRFPGYLSYGRLKLHPEWDPLRGDPSFGELVASLAPK